MTKSLRELAEARAALSGFFERFWLGPDGDYAGLEPLCLEELDALEQRYRWARRTVEALRHSEQAQSEMSRPRS